ncbi:tRNA pseudouridine(55) synthase TruB [Treponema brennaborense]|uniref:tRNA pseudouridine synthase B n=1 Tax=Treponema brennaborense (strain DSM 12168 / CIP 105900 / DD5/3) TaxID=906968 RepID=F4LJE1_TREBD|nr:tRNA pseudouridine(55) synthase TruB [Treponema brennaborense]AEE17386.1 tRNA pseudouridine synthase B [Treponema brennaborense DSM 12168]
MSGVLLYAKRPGPTSFASLGAVKKALGTGKVGHTGTLDSFAEGLLVVLAGKMTRLVSHITAFDKTYQAVIRFGTETDTLDPGGTVVESAPIPSLSELERVLPRFTGTISQVPPAYSAVHVDGKRASDVIRCGGSVTLSARSVAIRSLRLLDFAGGCALIEVSCSKGTYVRSLARDIAREAGSRAHLAALRRTAVGPFRLEDAVFSDTLAPFTVATESAAAVRSQPCPDSELADICRSLRAFTPETAQACGFYPVTVCSEHAGSYVNGRSLQNEWFVPFRPEQSCAAGGGRFAAADPAVAVDTDFAVFYGDGSFAGIVRRGGGRLSYGFVIQPGDFHA